MLTHVSFGPRDFGEHPLLPISRPYWEFYAAVRGSVAPLFPEGATLRPRAGMLWLFRPDCVHGWSGVKRARAGIVVFHFSEVPPELERAAARNGGWVGVHIDRRAQARLDRLARDLHPRFWNHDPLLAFRGQHALMELSLLMLENAEDTPANASPKARPSPASPLRVGAATKWLRTHLHECPGVLDLARTVGVSGAHLRRLFLAELGCTPKEWMTRVQLEVASDLLRRTDAKLETVAAESGFASCSTLCHAFRSAHGLTPTEWRAQFGENRTSAARTRESAQRPG